MSKIRHLSERRRRRQRQLEALDAALEKTLEEVEASRGNFTAELAAARALALSVHAEPMPTEPLVALRAGLAARQATRREKHRRHLVGSIPGAMAAAVAGLLLFVGLSGGQRPQNPGSSSAVATAARTLKVINDRMALVQTDVAAGNRDAAASTGASARDAMVQARDTASQLPADSPVRDLLLTAAYQEIAQLKALLAQLQLEVAPLPPPPPGATVGAAPTLGATTSSAPASSTSSSAPPTTAAPATTSTTTTLPKPTTTTTTSTTSSTTVTSVPPTTSTANNGQKTGQITTTSSTSSTTEPSTTSTS